VASPILVSIIENVWKTLNLALWYPIFIWYVLLVL